MLDDLKKVTLPEETDDALTIQIDTLSFSLKNILDALPDFEQFDFTAQQLDAFLAHVKHNKTIPRYKLAHPELHPAERLAITLWTSNIHREMQMLLRLGKIKEISDLPLILMATCIASQGLSKIKSPTRMKLTRSEGIDCRENYTAEREVCFAMKKLVINRGFTATAFNNSDYTGITFHQDESINPIGKDIHKLSAYKEENETVFPPFTEFKYVPDKKSWLAYPMRSINRDQESQYVHHFSAEQLQMITLCAAKPKLREIYQQFKQVLNKDKPYSKQNLFVAKPQRKISVLTEIAQHLDNFIKSAEPKQAAVDQLIQIIENNTRTGRPIRKLFSSSQWPSCVSNLLLFLKDLAPAYNAPSHTPMCSPL